MARPSSNSLARVGDGSPLMDAWPVTVLSLDPSWTRFVWPVTGLAMASSRVPSCNPSCKPQHETVLSRTVLSPPPSRRVARRRSRRGPVIGPSWFPTSPVARPSSNSLSHVGDGCPLLDAWPVAVLSLDPSWTCLVWPVTGLAMASSRVPSCNSRVFLWPIPSCKPQHVTSCPVV